MKLWHMYRREFGCGYAIGRDRFCRIIDENGLKVRLKVRKPRTTDSTHGLQTYPNLIKDFVPTAANQLWVSDITYIVIMDDESHYHFCYLSMVLDAYTEEIIGWSVGPTLDTTYPLEALRMALRRIEGKDAVLIHHSDRGCQYASREYVGLLLERGIRISMTESGDPKDNAQAERIKNGAIELGKALEGLVVRIPNKASESGKLFGSVSTIQIANAIKEAKNIDIDRKNISISEDAIKNVGSYKATIKLHKEVSVEIGFEVYAE